MIEISNYYAIKKNGKEVGRIQLVGDKTPQIEYLLDEEYWNQGIMTFELKKYLKMIKDKCPKVMAIVEKNNHASQRVLVKVGFLKLTSMRDYFVFVNDLTASKERRIVMQSLVDSGFVKKFKKNR